MTSALKCKVSLSLPQDLIKLVDQDARRRNDTRSGAIEKWLRRAANATVEDEIADATAAYYHSLQGDGRQDDIALAHGLSKAAKRIKRDDVARPPARARRHRAA